MGRGVFIQFLILSLLTLWGCYPEDFDKNSWGPDPILELSTLSVVLGPEEGSEARVTVSSNYKSWFVEEKGENQGWCSFRQDGDDLVISAIRNTTVSERQTVLVVVTGNVYNEKRVEIAVTQLYADYVLSLDPSELIFSNYGEEQYVSILSDVEEWRATVTLGSEWCVAEIFGNQLLVKVLPNNNKGYREAIITVNDIKGVRSTTLKVTQMGTEKIFEVEPLEIFPVDGGTQTVRVTSYNDAWMVSVPQSEASWCSAEKFGNELIVTVQANNTGKPRSCKLLMSSGDGSMKQLVEVEQESFPVRPGGNIGEWDPGDSQGGDLEELVQERDILIEFYYEMGGDSWADATGWKTQKPLSEWRGVTLDSKGYVIGLNLENNGLSGNLSSILSGLSRLKELKISRNHIVGSVPADIQVMPCYVRDDVALQYNAQGEPVYLNEETLK